MLLEKLAAIAFSVSISSFVESENKSMPSSERISSLFVHAGFCFYTTAFFLGLKFRAIRKLPKEALANLQQVPSSSYKKEVHKALEKALSEESLPGKPYALKIQEMISSLPNMIKDKNPAAFVRNRISVLDAQGMMINTLQVGFDEPSKKIWIGAPNNMEARERSALSWTSRYLFSTVLEEDPFMTKWEAISHFAAFCIAYLAPDVKKLPIITYGAVNLLSAIFIDRYVQSRRWDFATRNSSLQEKKGALAYFQYLNELAKESIPSWVLCLRDVFTLNESNRVVTHLQSAVAVDEELAKKQRDQSILTRISRCFSSV